MNRLKSRTLIAALLVGILPSCGLYSVLTFDSDRQRSHIDGRYRLIVVTAGTAPASPGVPPEASARAVNECIDIIEPNQLTGAVLGGIAVAFAVGFVYDQINDAIATRVAKLEAQSAPKPATLRSAVPDLQFGKPDSSTTCIYVERYRIISEIGQQPREERLFSFAAVPVREDDVNWRWVTNGITMSHARALTANDEKVRVDIALSLSGNIARNQVPTQVAPSVENFSFNIKPSGDSKNPVRARAEPTAAAYLHLPRLAMSGPWPSMVGISISEIGSGSGLFKDALAGQERNKASMRKLLLDITGAYDGAGRL